MYRSPSSFRHIATRVIVYGIMTLAVLFLATASLLYILGYRFDNVDNRIEQSGLVQYITKPDGATVTIDDSVFDRRTPSNSTVTSGEHEFTFSRDGYQPWHKTLTIKPGTLTWLNYARLIPNELTVESVANLPSVSQALKTPNRKYMAIMPQADKPTVRIYDLTNDSIRTTTMTVAADEYETNGRPGDKHVFRMIEWDASGHYLLMKHTFGKTIEWLVFDRQTSKLVSNVTKMMDVAISSASIVDDNGPTIIALTDDSIRRIRLDGETVSRPLVSNVATFEVHNKGAITYVTVPNKTTKKRQVGLVTDSGQPVVVYTTTSASPKSIHAAAGRYFDKDYIAISEGGRVILLSGTFPRKQSDATSLKTTNILTFPKSVSWLRMSPEDRFVVVQTGTLLQSYDIERSRVSDVLTIGGAKHPRPAAWLDSYHIWSDDDGTLRMKEFDGTNQHKINSVAPNFDALITPNGKYLYSIDKSGNGYQLQRVKLIL